ncbi:MAG: hydrogenase iron-sulfur subunit [bacterium]|nr:hydrogenase iron-sulfur subunit [bacterium]
MSKQTSKMVNITIDGRQVQAVYRAPLLTVARELGISIPTLCHHEALEPAGACRLCLVEEVRDGWSKFVTACNYPVDEGMTFLTTSEAVLRYRRMTMEALYARCPEVPAVRDLAVKLGVDTSRFIAGDETCILCGMCTRVCDSYATAAIATMGRGSEKIVGTFADTLPDDCVGCSSCAMICPTNHIPVTRSEGVLRIWERDFPLATAHVAVDECRACGACEEACPFSIPRVVHKKDGIAFAEIREDVCRGCGVCVAACPSGAIKQIASQRDLPARAGELLVIACGRSNLTGHAAPTLPDNVRVLELPCTGAVSPAMLLGALGRGYNGVLVLGRHQETCRLNGAEDHARVLVERMDDLAQMVGLGAERLRFVEPDAGQDGPFAAIDEVLNELPPTPLAERFGDELNDSLDSILPLVKWLCGRPELKIAAEAWLEEKGLPLAKPGEPVLLAKAIPWLDILLGEWLRGDGLVDILVDTLAVLRKLGIEAGIAVSGFQGKIDGMVDLYPGSKFYGFCPVGVKAARDAGVDITLVTDLLLERVGELKTETVRTVAVDPALENVAAVARAQGHTVVATESLPEVGLRMTITDGERQALNRILTQAESAGAEALLLAGPRQLIQYLLLGREGAWRGTHIRPLLASGLVAADLAERQV